MSSTKRQGVRPKSRSRSPVQTGRSGPGHRPASMRTTGKKNPGSSRRPSADPPPFCDFACPYATFPPADAVGACRREAGVFCSLLKRYNNKNATCLVTKPRG
jgi:hypothetical protein